MQPSEQQSQTERLAYTLQHNSWHAQGDKFKIRVFRELAELSMRFDRLEQAIQKGQTNATE